MHRLFVRSAAPASPAVTLIGLLLGVLQLGGVVLAGAVSAKPVKDVLLLAVGDPAAAQLIELDSAGRQRRLPLSAEVRTPLGSVWKLFVHAYLLDTAATESPYQCQGVQRDEVYCCGRGQSIERDQALVQSCGLYFAPQRLGIDAAHWRDYWRARSAPGWLSELHALEAERQVPVLELLGVLSGLPAQAHLRALLLDVLLQEGLQEVVTVAGSQLRVKTWSWHQADALEQRIGGFAGWLADGRPIWAQSTGTSRSVLQRFAQALQTQLRSAWPSEPGQCVEVNLFARYPITDVQQQGRPVGAGILRGEYRLRFANGNQFDILSSGELVLSESGKSWRITARLDREDYVARVLDREAAAEPEAAARALAVAIRSYLQQNAERRGDCLRIDDSSALQRVAARPPSAAARAVAAWSADLVIAGSPVRYHLDTSAANQLSWRQAVTQAGAGANYARILNDAFPQGNLARWGRPQSDCQALPEAERWLQSRLPSWRSRLDSEPGYEPIRAQVCRLQSGRPHVDRARQRIYVRGLLSQQDRLDLTHEYLHLAFSAHPSGGDEVFIEQLTRSLLLESAR